MKKSMFLSIIALLIAIAGAGIALAAYFSKKQCVMCDDFDDFDDEDPIPDDADDIGYFTEELDPSAEEPEMEPVQNPGNSAALDDDDEDED